MPGRRRPSSGDPITSKMAMDEVRERIAARPNRLLHAFAALSMTTAVVPTGDFSSWAGCEYGDLKQSVAVRGVTARSNSSAMWVFTSRWRNSSECGR